MAREDYERLMEKVSRENEKLRDFTDFERLMKLVGEQMDEIEVLESRIDALQSEHERISLDYGERIRNLEETIRKDDLRIVNLQRRTINSEGEILLLKGH